MSLSKPILTDDDMSVVHFFRGEMQRMTVWRTRLDATSHWAILLTTGMTTFTLGSRDVPHYIILLGLLLNTILMLIEGRRYQHLHHSKWRLQMLEHNFFAGRILPDCELVEPNWRVQLATDLARPHFTIGLALATRLRLRRNYLMLVCFIYAVWITKLFIHPDSPNSAADILARMAVGDLVPDWFVAATALSALVAFVALAVLTPSEESLEQWTKEKRHAAAVARGEPTGDCKER